jgi:hypothetical protein
MAPLKRNDVLLFARLEHSSCPFGFISPMFSAATAGPTATIAVDAPWLLTETHTVGIPSSFSFSFTSFPGCGSLRPQKNEVAVATRSAATQQK